jgi:TetR/AcrR family fatty acid metabolism transcriptional regulator
VLISIFEDRMGRLLEVLRQDLAAGDAIQDQIRRVIELQLGLLEGRRDLAEVITVNLRQSSPLLKQYAAPLFNEYLDVIAGVFAEGQRQGVVRPDLSPRILARSLWGGLDGLALTWTLSDGKTETLRKAAQQFSSVFLQGVLAP